MAGSAVQDTKRVLSGMEKDAAREGPPLPPPQLSTAPAVTSRVQQQTLIMGPERQNEQEETTRHDIAK